MYAQVLYFDYFPFFYKKKKSDSFESNSKNLGLTLLPQVYPFRVVCTIHSKFKHFLKQIFRALIIFTSQFEPPLSPLPSKTRRMAFVPKNPSPTRRSGRRKGVTDALLHFRILYVVSKVIRDMTVSGLLSCHAECRQPDIQKYFSDITHVKWVA